MGKQGAGVTLQEKSRSGVTSMARSGHPKQTGGGGGAGRMNISEDALQDEFIFSGGSGGPQVPQYMRTFGAKSDKAAYHPGSSYMGANGATAAAGGFMHKVAQSSHHL